tara:strand:+ start:571 stop:1266 length:696 start_codon:yes stop_codon:yes gene_type:complete
MAIINVALSDTFDQWRTKTNTLGTNQGDLASLDAGFAGSDLVSCLNELRSGEDLTQLILGDSSGVGNNRIKLGDGTDMQIYHDGTNSNITNQTGFLYVVSDSLQLRSASDERYLAAVANGAVSLYHDDAKKLETTATGINVTGEVDMDTLKMPDLTAGKMLIADGTSYQEVTMSGDASIASGGSLTIATGAVTSTKIQDNTIVSADFNNTVTLNIKNSSGTVLKTLRSPGS